MTGEFVCGGLPRDEAKEPGVDMSVLQIISIRILGLLEVLGVVCAVGHVPQLEQDWSDLLGRKQVSTN